MKITIESTARIVNANGVPCRVWQGETESGIKVQCLVPRISARSDQDLAQFKRELHEETAPADADAIMSFPLRMIL
jgi:hypothetical protein